MGAVLEERFTSKYEVGPCGCWLWTAARDRRGYGVYMRQRAEVRETGKARRVFAHRYAYEALVGPIPDGLCIDHLCRTPSCVNPEHMDVVSVGENTRRGAGYGHALWDGTTRPITRPTRCPHGHEYTPENSYIDRHGHRKCRTCVLARMRKPPRPPRTHCKRGHPWTLGNIYHRTDGYTRCRLCMNADQRAYQARKRAS